MKRLVATALGLAAMTAVASTTPFGHAVWDQLRSVAEPLFDRGEATQPRFDQFYADMVEALPPQQQTERALELAINRYEGAAQYVIDNAQTWRTQFGRTERLTSLITTALNSPLIEIRMAAFEVHLAEFDLEKSSDEVDRLIDRMHDDVDGAGPWALWSIGIIGARGVDRERIFNELTIATNHPDSRLRRWAVDALAKLGGVEVIDPLLTIAVNDPSPVVRERAFCGLAQSGTLHLAERYQALPGLLAIAEDPASNGQTRDWAYQALREISGVYNLREEPSVWRDQLIDLEML